MNHIQSRHDTLKRSLQLIVKRIEKKLDNTQKGRFIHEFDNRDELLVKLNKDLIHYRGVLHGVDICSDFFK